MRSPMSSKTRHLLAPMLLLLGGCHRPAPAAPSPALPPIRVDTAVAAERRVPKTLTITGVLEANQRTELAANATGQVVRTFVERGSRVNAGAALAQLDARAAVLSQVQAEANERGTVEQLKSLRADCERYERLLKTGAVTQQEYDRTATQCRTQSSTEEAARARAADARRMLKDATVRAPFAGLIAERFVHVGDYVRPDSRVVTLLVDDPLRLKLTVPEPYLPFIKEGLTVTFETVAAPGREFTATIKYLGREVRANTRDVIEEAVVANPDGALYPGMFVTARLPVGEMLASVVPKDAVVVGDSGPTVFVVVDKHLQQRPVQAGVRMGELLAIQDGLRSGERVVVHPGKNATDGALVE
jgi:membrane fusion protein, multidrug efflux system